LKPEEVIMEAVAVHGVMSTLTEEDGDIKTIWDSTKPDEVAAARAQFDEMRKKGYLAYTVKKKDGEKNDMITKFDPTLESIILVPPVQGG
jgi:hypothetical protein